MDEQNPLSEAVFYILLSLAPAPQHGYAILKEAKRMSNGRINLSTGTLYGAIKRLLEQGWIVPIEESERADTKRHPKAYRLTRRGQRVINIEVERLEALTRIAKRQLKGHSL